MAIYNLFLNPFVYDLDDVSPKIIENRRYSMKDIGDLDSRIKNLEYYTSLSLLEQSAADVELFDGSGFSRLKNGFIVDGFKGHNVGDTANPDYTASIDKKNGILRVVLNLKSDLYSLCKISVLSKLDTKLTNLSSFTSKIIPVSLILETVSRYFRYSLLLFTFSVLTIT